MYKHIPIPKEGPDLRIRRILSVVLVVAGEILMFLVPAHVVVGAVMAAVGVAVELIGIAVGDHQIKKPLKSVKKRRHCEHSETISSFPQVIVRLLCRAVPPNADFFRHLLARQAFVRSQPCAVTGPWR
jgi:hypothetical protein